MSGLAFLAAPWLAALGALLLPIALHLWSRGRARRVPVGSVRWLKAAAPRRARRLRPSQLWLLLLRCLLLAALALALAEPRVEVAADARQEPWLLVSPELLGTPALAAELSTLAGLDAERRLLAPGLPPLDAGAAGIADLAAADLWAMVRAADAEAPPGTAFVVLAPDRLEALRGRRPKLRREVDWRALPVTAEQTWVERLGPGPNAEDRWPAWIATSSPERTVVERREVTSPAEVGLEATDAPLATPAKVRIRHAPEEVEAAETLRLALEAVAEVIELPLAVELAARDGGGAGGERTVLARGEVGRPLLEAVLPAGDASAELELVLHPGGGAAWRRLAASAALPETLRPAVEGLLAGRVASGRGPTSDLRTAAGQGRPEVAEPSDRPATRPSRRLELGLWLAVGLLLVAERSLARRPP